VRCQLRPAMPHPGKSVTGEDTQNRLAPKVSELVGPMMWNGTRGNVLAPAGDPQRILTKNPDPSTVALATTVLIKSSPPLGTKRSTYLSSFIK